MRPTTNEWAPDTCGCVLQFSFDGDADPATRVHIPAAVVNRCPAHVGLADNALHAAIGAGGHYHQLPGVGENTRKNLAESEALGLLTSLTQATIDPSGVTVTAWKPGTAFSFSFDANRVLHVTVTGRSKAHQAALQAALDAVLGAGQAVVE